MRGVALSYALYLPSQYSAARPWPILYCLDPGAQVALEWAGGAKLAGVVACGAAAGPSVPPQSLRYLLFLAAGVDDFNYHEVHAASVELAKRGVGHRWVEFEGGQQWLPGPLALEALQFFAGRAPAQAAVMFETATLGRPDVPGVWYWLAVSRAAAGSKGQALDALEAAAARGFRDWQRMDAEPLLAPLRSEARYKALAQCPIKK